MSKEKTKKPALKKAETLVITRTIDAPREIIWRAWTEPESVKRWWGPKGFTTPFSKIDLRPGGSYLNCMRSPENKDYWSTGVYREIVPLKRIVCTDSFADEKGNVVPASYYGMSADFQLEMLITVTFSDDNGRTKLTIEHTGFPSVKDSDMAKESWNQLLDKLVETLQRQG